MNIDKSKREVSVNELEQIKDKYPQMVQNFEEVKKQAYQPQPQELGQVRRQQAQPREKYLEQGRGPAEDQQGQTD